MYIYVDFENETKQQLLQVRQEYIVQTKELKHTTKEKHRFEVEAFKLQGQVKQLETELQQMIKQRDNTEGIFAD